MEDTRLVKKVTVYTTSFCPYCVRAKQLLTSKGIPFEEINLGDKPDELNALKKRTGWRTVPQIFIGDELIGGFSELAELESKKLLDGKLA